MCGSVYAVDGEATTELTLQQACEDYAEVWINGLKDDPNITYTTKESIEITDINDNPYGYCVIMQVDGVQRGYVMVNPYNLDSYVSEYALDGEGLYDSITNRASSTLARSALSTQEKKLVKVSDFDYMTEINTGSEKSYIGMDGTISSEQEVENNINALPEALANISPYSAIGDVIMDAALMGVETSEKRDITGYNLRVFSKDDFESNGREYSCAGVTAANIMYYYKMARGKTNLLINSNLYQTYDKLLTDMNIQYNPDGYGCNIGDAKYGISKYIRDRGYTCTTSSNLSDWSSIKSNINNNRPFYWAYNVSNLGHAIEVVGYTVTQNGVFNKYLRVADTWNTYYRFFSFERVASNNQQGFAITIG